MILTLTKVILYQARFLVIGYSLSAQTLNKYSAVMVLDFYELAIHKVFVKNIYKKTKQLDLNFSC